MAKAERGGRGFRHRINGDEEVSFICLYLCLIRACALTRQYVRLQQQAIRIIIPPLVLLTKKPHCARESEDNREGNRRLGGGGKSNFNLSAKKTRRF